MIHRLRDMIGTPNCQTEFPHAFDGKTYWVRAVPEPFYGGLLDRIRDAAAILSGSAFAVHWPDAGELEDAVGLLKQKPKRSAGDVAVGVGDP